MFTPLTKFISEVANHAIEKRSRLLGTLFAEWKAIVGLELSPHVSPFKITKTHRGTILHLQVFESIALQIKYQIPMIRERIDTMMGPGMIDQIRLHTISGHPPSLSEPQSLTLSYKHQQALDRITTPIEDPKLKQALLEYGQAIFLRTP